ncbi:MAG TPA: hypothetical protein VGA04_18265 [Streptosporangiaceae bacterium]
MVSATTVAMMLGRPGRGSRPDPGSKARPIPTVAVAGKLRAVVSAAAVDGRVDSLRRWERADTSP